MTSSSDLLENHVRKQTRRRWVPFSSLRDRLMLLVLLAFLPALGLIIYEGVEQRQQAIIRAQESARGVARLVASDLGRVMEGTRQLLMAIAQYPAVSDHDAAACGRFVAGLQRQNPLYSQLGAALPNGDVFCSAIRPSQQLNCGDRPFFQEALRTQDFAVGDYVIMRGSGDPGIAAVYPALDETGQARAVVFAGINLTWLDGLLGQARLPEGSTLALVDSTGTVVTHYPDPEHWRGQELPAPLLQSLSSQDEGLADLIGLDGVPWLYAFTRLCCTQGSASYLVVGIPRSVAFAEADRTLARNLIALGVATMLVLALTRSAGRAFIMRPVQGLLGAIKRFDSGDWSARTGQPHDDGELGKLAQAIDQMAATVEMREIERDRSEQELRRYSTRAEALRSIAARLNAQLNLERVLDAVCEETARALSVPAASVSLCDAGDGALRPAACCGLPDEFCDQVQGLLAAITLPLGQGEVALFADVAEQPDLPDTPLLATLGVRTFASAPMVQEGELVGALCIFTFGQPRRFSEDEIGFLRAIADQAANAVANARLYESLKREQRLRGELLRNLISAQEDERQRIARELHDETSQGLSVLILSLETVDMELAQAGQEASRPAQMARAVAQSMLEGIRRLIGDLRPSLLDDLGLVPAIAWYAGQRLEALGIEVDLQCDLPDERRLPAAMETALFRIAQEAISNAARHSGATRVTISLRIAAESAILAIEDDGRGFEMAAGSVRQPSGRGLGLQGVRERVRILGGEFSLRSAPGRGTRLEVSVPFTPEEAGDEQDAGSPG